MNFGTVLLLIIALAVGLFLFSKFWPREWVQFANKITGPFGRVRWILPDNLDHNHSRLVEKAYKLAYFSLNDALAHSHLTSAERRSLKAESQQIPENIVELMYKMSRMRRLRSSLDRDDSNYSEVLSFEDEISNEIESAMSILSSIPVALTRVEISKGDRTFENLLSELDETNKRMKDLAESWRDMRSSTF